MPPRTRSTPFAILGLLSFEPMSGYDIRREASASIGYFWNESYGQIYPALRDLASAGLIRPRAGAPSSGRERRIYQITPRGRVALKRWRTQPPRPAPVRNELLLKLFFGNAATAAADLAWIADLMKTESERLAEFRRIRGQLRAERRGHPSLPFWLATLSYGEHHSRAVLRWGRETMRALRRTSP